MYHLKLLTNETTKIIRNTKNKKTKDENCENLPHLENYEVILSAVIMNTNQETCIRFYPMNCLFSH